MTLVMLLDRYSNDIFISKLSLKAITLLCCTSNKLYNLLYDEYDKLIGNISVYTWSKRHTLHIYLWGTGAEHFAKYYNYVINCSKYIEDDGILINNELNSKWACWGWIKTSNNTVESGYISLKLLDNNFEWYGKYGETINEEDILFDILHYYYLNNNISFDKLEIITGKLAGNNELVKKPDVIIKYY